uniref:Arb2 domain-containing protein n=1 Tax=Electrophorus electricus TaxID=8005 RepID=A0A4W4FYH9_ELEEL
MLFGADVFVFCFAWLTMAQLLAQEDKEKTTALKDLLSRIDLDELMKKDEPPLVFPKTLEEFEYAFNEHGQLRHTKTGEPFVFNHKEDLHRWNQKRYEALGEEGYGVVVLNPNDNFLEVEKAEEPGGGEAAPDGSDEPAEKRERKEERESKRRTDFYEKYRNPQKEKETDRIPIRGNSSPEEHTLYVWDHFISTSLAKNIFVVAHSYGGLSFLDLMIQREEEVKSRVRAVAMTDSVHNVWHQNANRSIQGWLKERCCNWVSSPEPLDTPVEPMLPDCLHLSAGTERHDLTSWRSFHSIFRFFSKHMEQDESVEQDEEKEPDDREVSTATPVSMRSSNRARHEDL